MSFFAELKRRNVFRVGIAYAITSWLLIQVADILLETIGAPPWVMQTMFVVLGVGLIIALFFAWAFELTPEGVKREADVDRSQSIAPQTGQKLNRTIIAIMAMALVYFVTDKFFLSSSKLSTTEIVVSETLDTPQVPQQTLQTIAVLPFVDMSANNDNEYFSDGLTEELLNILAKIRELRVAGRTSSFAFKGKNEDLRSIGQKLDVKTILEGSVRKDNKSNRVRITAQLVNVDDGYHLWSETYDRDLDDIFAIQEEIARKVAKALRITLLGEDEARIAAQTITDVSAYDLYLRGLQQLNKHSFASIKEAITTFEQVLEKDPDYTPSAIKLAKAWLDLAYTGATSQAEAIDNAQPLLNPILEMDAANSDAHVLMARVMWAKKNRIGREQHLKMALDDDPRNVAALSEMSRYLYRENGNVQKGLEYLKEAERIDPYSVDVLWDLISFSAFTMQPEIAEAYAERTAEIQPENPNRYWGPGMAYLVSGKLATALDYQIKSSGLDPNDYEFKAGIAATWLALGDIEQAEFWAKQADAIGADQPYPIMARVMMYQYREQNGMAADMAKRVLDREMDNRLGSNNVLRRAYISDLVRRGDITQAIDFYHDHFPDAFTKPLALDMVTYQKAGQLIDIAVLLQMLDPGSAQAVELINAAEEKNQSRDERLMPWARARDRAAVAAVRNDKQAALEHLQYAVELGMRWRWQSTMFSTIAFNSLHDEPEFKNLVSVIEADMQQQREEAYKLPGVLR